MATVIARDVLPDWSPNEPEFWEGTAKPVAWKTLWITTFCLLLSFSTWFMVSAIVVKLTGIGFKFDKGQLFWLNAMPGLTQTGGETSGAYLPQCIPKKSPTGHSTEGCS